MSATRILVLGAGGMAGHVTTLFLRESGFIVDTLSASNRLDENTWLIDVSDRQKLEDVLNSNSYDFVINCIGLLVKESDERRDLAVYLNSYLPRFLEKYYKSSKTRVIHISTDDVFSSDGRPHQENSSYDGESFYGRTKALGEIINAKDLTFRMSVVGPDTKMSGTGLFNWFYNQTGEIHGYTNAMWNGITTLVLAKAIKAAIEQNLTGLYHLVPKNNISKYSLLQLFKTVFDRQDLMIKPVEALAVDKTLLNTRQDFNYNVPDYSTMVSDMKVWIDRHPKLYKHYER